MRNTVSLIIIIINHGKENRSPGGRQSRPQTATPLDVVRDETKCF